MAAGLLILAIVLRRPDLVVLAAPFALGTAAGLAFGRPAGPPAVELTVGQDALLEEDPFAAQVAVSTPSTVDAATVRLPGAWIRPRVGTLAQCASITAGRTVFTFPVQARRWGRIPVGPAELQATTAFGLLRYGPVVASPRVVLVWPLRAAFIATDVVPRAEGLVGPHRSRRPGDGTDVAGVRPFLAGDRLRRINWRVSTRTGSLHVTSTLSDRDTDVLLCLDSGYDVGGSLDTGVRAAAAIAEYYLRTGDRVGLLDLGQPQRRVPQGNGRGHLVRILDVLLDVRDRPSTMDDVPRALGNLPASALLVVMLTPLLGDDAVGVLSRMTRGNRSVVVIDTLPEDYRPRERSEWTDLAWQVAQLQREADIGRLAELGLPVVPWRGAGTLDEVLREIARTARAPRAR